MKTTFDLPEALLRDVQAVARDRRTTTKSLVEEALRRLLDDYTGQQQPFRLRDASVKGRGLAPEYAEGGWERMRELAYGTDR